MRPPVSPSKRGIEFPLNEANSLDGIISYLTWKHGGNLHDQGIVAITSKSGSYDNVWALRNVADLTSGLYFCSANEPGQWVCWDFHEMRVRPTHYTIRTWQLKSWVVEGSLDFVNWIEIDRQTNTEDSKFLMSRTASFAVSNSAECRLIRLTSKGYNSGGDSYLVIHAFEVFGALLE
jgi:hypothetical protein